MYTSQEQSLLVEGMEVWCDDPERGSGGKVDKLQFLNESARVLAGLEKTMLAFTEQQRAANEGITAALTGLNSITATLAGTLTTLTPLVANLDTPIGRGSITVGSESREGTGEK